MRRTPGGTRGRLRSLADAVMGGASWVVVWLVALDAAAAPAKPATKLVHVADTRGLGPGLTLWVADLYNTSYWLYGLAVVATMALMGVVLGYGCDALMSRLGIDLGRMQHHE
jgi:hypothetical protein